MDPCCQAYPDLTIRGHRNDPVLFESWCEAGNESWLPAAAVSVARFVDEQTPSKSIATVKRRISAIQFAHRMADIPSPIDHSEVRLAVRRVARFNSGVRRKRLVSPPTCWKKFCPETLAALRDAALLTVGYDTLCRSSELVVMRVGHLGDYNATIHVPRSASDPW